MNLFSYASHICDLHYLDDFDYKSEPNGVNNSDDKMASDDTTARNPNLNTTNSANIEIRTEEVLNETRTINDLNSTNTSQCQSTNLTTDSTLLLDSSCLSSSTEHISEDGRSTVIMSENSINAIISKNIKVSEQCNSNCENPQNSYHQPITIDLTDDDVDIGKTIELDTSKYSNLTHKNPVPDTTYFIDLTEEVDVSASLLMDKIDHIDGTHSASAYLIEAAEHHLARKPFSKGNAQSHTISSIDKASKPQSYVAHEENFKAVDSTQQDIDVHLARAQSFCLSSLLNCEFCGILTSSRQVLAFHLESQHKQQHFPCVICGYLFKVTNDLVGHYRIDHHNVDLKQAELAALIDKKSDPTKKFYYYCNQCGRGFDALYLMLEHKRKLVLFKSHIIETNLTFLFNETSNPRKSNPKSNDFSVGVQSIAPGDRIGFAASDSNPINGNDDINESNEGNNKTTNVTQDIDLSLTMTASNASLETNKNLVICEEDRVGRTDEELSSTLSFQNEPSRSILCQLGNKPMENRMQLNEDQQSSEDKEIFVCYFCSKNFSTKKSLKIHYGRMHKPCALEKEIRVEYELNKSNKKTILIAIPNSPIFENPESEVAKENSENVKIKRCDNAILQSAGASQNTLESQTTCDRRTENGNHDEGNILSVNIIKRDESKRKSGSIVVRKNEHTSRVIDNSSMTSEGIPEYTSKVARTAQNVSLPTTSEDNVYNPKEACNNMKQRSDEPLKTSELNVAKASETKNNLRTSKCHQSASNSKRDHSRHKVYQAKRKENPSDKNKINDVKNKSVSISEVRTKKDKGITSYKKNPLAVAKKSHGKLREDFKFDEASPRDKDHLQISGIAKESARNKDLARNSSLVNKTKSAFLPLPLKIMRIKKDTKTSNNKPINIPKEIIDTKTKEVVKSRDKRDRSENIHKPSIKDCDKKHGISSKKMKPSSSKNNINKKLDVRPAISHENPKKLLTLMQYNNTETSVNIFNNTAPQPEMLSVIPKVNTCIESLDNAVAPGECLTTSNKQEVLPQSLQPNAIGNMHFYSPREMDIIIEVSQQISIQRNRTNSDTAQFSDEPDTGEESLQLNTESIFCEACGLQTFSTNSLQDHMKNMHRGFRFTCFVCDGDYDTIDKLTRHQVKYAKSVLVFAESKFLRQRKSIPNQLYPYYCSFCGKGFTQIESITNHKRDEHKKGRSEVIQPIFKEPCMTTYSDISQGNSRDGSKPGQDIFIDDHTREGRNGKDSCKNKDNESPLDESNKSDCNSVRSTGNTNDTNPEIVFEFCELCGEKHSSLADKRKHFHIKGFECIICHRTLDGLDSLAKHYDLCHMRHEIINFELMESSIQEKYKYFCMFCGIGFHFIDEVLTHREMIHYELIRERLAEECGKNNEHNSENIQNRNVDNLFKVDEDIVKPEDREMVFPRANENNDEILNVTVDQKSVGDISVQEIFKIPTNIPGFNVEDIDKNDEDDSNKTENQEVPSISEDQSVILNKCNSAVDESNVRADRLIISDPDSNAGDLIIDLTDSSSRDSFGKDESFMDVHEYLKDKNIDYTSPSVDNGKEVVTSDLNKEGLNGTNVRENRDNLGMIFCEACGRRFEDEEALDLHECFQCSTCESFYPDIATLIRHQNEIHHIKTVVTTDKLPEQCSTSKLPKRFRYYCDSCGYGDNYLSYMSFHRLVACPWKTRAASVSKKPKGSENSTKLSSISNKLQRSDHKNKPCRTSVKAQNKPFSCPVCRTRSFVSEVALRDHEMSSMRHQRKLLTTGSDLKENTEVNVIPTLVETDNVALVKMRPKNRQKYQLSNSRGGSSYCYPTPDDDVYRGRSLDRPSHSAKRKRNQSGKSPDRLGKYDPKKTPEGEGYRARSSDRSSLSVNRKRSPSGKSPERLKQYDHKKTPEGEVYRGRSLDRSRHNDKRKRSHSGKSPEALGQYNHKKSQNIKGYGYIGSEDSDMETAINMRKGY